MGIALDAVGIALDALVMHWALWNGFGSGCCGGHGYRSAARHLQNETMLQAVAAERYQGKLLLI